MAFGCLFGCYNTVGIYPGVYLPLGVILITAVSLPTALIYVLLSYALPRTGGDYVWVSRTLHPALGFMVNFTFTIVALSFISIDAVYLLPAYIQTGFYGLSVLTGQASYASIADSLSNYTSIAAYVFTAFPLVLLMIWGLRGTRKFLWASFFAGAIAVLVTIGSLALANSSLLAADFKSISGHTIEEVLSTAEKEGWVPGYTFSGTLLGGVYAFLNMIGFNAQAYVASEIKGSYRARTHAIAVIGSLVLLGGLTAILYYLVYGVFGQFYNAVTFLWATGSASYGSYFPFPWIHSAALLAYLKVSPALYMAIHLLIPFSYLASIIAWGAVAIRNVFAWSFDGILPFKFAEVDRRGNPWLATLLILVVAEAITAVFLAYPQWASWLAYEMFIWAIGWAIVGISAAVFPIKMKGFYQQLTGPIRASLAGIPVITIIGLITALANAIIGYAILSPAFIGTLQINFLLASIGLVILSVIIYFIAYAARKMRGIDLNAVYRYIPPE
jgi:amino acid transporter